MHPRIIFGDRKPKGRDVETADRRQQRIGIDDLVVLGLDQDVTQILVSLGLVKLRDERGKYAVATRRRSY